MNENENENTKALTKTDSLIYNFLEKNNYKTDDNKFEILDSNDLVKEKSSVEDFLVWLDSNIDEEFNTINKPTDIEMTNDKYVDGDYTVTEASKFEKIVTQNVACLGNIICNNNKLIISVSNDLYLKCQNTKNNLAPVLENWYNTIKNEIKRINRSNKWSLAIFLNSKITNRIKAASDNIAVSFSNLKKSGETDKKTERMSIDNISFK